MSVLDWEFKGDNPLTRGYQHLHIAVDDVEDENLLRYFPQSNAFIHKGLKYWQPEKHTNQDTQSSQGPDPLDIGAGNGVFIHW